MRKNIFLIICISLFLAYLGVDIVVAGSLNARNVAGDGYKPAQTVTAWAMGQDRYRICTSWDATTCQGDGVILVERGHSPREGRAYAAYYARYPSFMWQRARSIGPGLEGFIVTLLIAGIYLMFRPRQRPRDED